MAAEPRRHRCPRLNVAEHAGRGWLLTKWSRSHPLPAVLTCVACSVTWLFVQVSSVWFARAAGEIRGLGDQTYGDFIASVYTLIYNVRGGL